MVYRICVIAMVMALAGVVCLGQKASGSTTTITPQNQQAISMAQSLHDQMNQLELTGDLNGMLRYFTDNVVRMDNNRPMEVGRDAWLTSQTAMRTGATGFKTQSISTHVTNAWSDGSRLYEYGTTSMSVMINGTIVDDPTKYFAVWVLNPTGAPQIELLIWNMTGTTSQGAQAAVAQAVKP